jgi:hypothetical protein
MSSRCARIEPPRAAFASARRIRRGSRRWLLSRPKPIVPAVATSTRMRSMLWKVCAAQRG